MVVKKKNKPIPMNMNINGTVNAAVPPKKVTVVSDRINHIKPAIVFITKRYWLSVKLKALKTIVTITTDANWIVSLNTIIKYYSNVIYNFILIDRLTLQQPTRLGLVR